MSKPAGAAQRSARLAHITDIHLQPELDAARGFAQCLHHLQAQTDAPTLILNTGDCIMDAFSAGEARTQLQWDLWKTVLREECSLPIEHALGNHDYWGVNRTRSGTNGTEPRWGKRWALEVLGLEKSYRSFDRFGWHFVILDSIDRLQDGYKARLGAEQMDWLQQDLAATPKSTPVLVMSHAPIVSPGVLLNGVQLAEDQNFKVSGSLMHLDSAALHKLFLEQGNVKLCLSGHVHLLDRAEYDGITYISSGAVCSGCWRGIRLGRIDYGYALLDLFEDGSFRHEHVSYGWKTAAGGA